MSGTGPNIFVDVSGAAAALSISRQALALVANAANTVMVSANGASTQNRSELNFVNTASVSVSVTPGQNNNTNIAFTAVGSGFGTVQSVNTGIGLSGGPISVSGTISANIANTTQPGITQLTDSISSNDTANAATANAAKWAANIALSANSIAQTASVVANSANALAQSASVIANSAANSVAVYANGTLILSNSDVNFNNTSTINVAASANGTSQSNLAFNANVSAIAGPAFAQANLANSIAQSAYSQANTATTTAQNAYAEANLAAITVGAAYAQANLATSIASSGYAEANVANALAQTASTTANSSANTTAIFANGTLTLAKANINFNNTGTINVSSTANGTGQVNIAFTVNTSAVGGGNSGGGNYQTDVYANGTLTLANADLNFNNTATINISTSANGIAQANLSFVANVSAIAGPAYAQANLANSIAQSAYSQANTATTTAGSAYNQSNTAITIADSALSQATAANSLAQTAYTQANSAYAQANAANVVAQTAYIAANSAANTVATFANGSLILASGNLNFNNTSTLNVAISANGSTQTDVALNSNVSAIVGPYASIANATFGTVNTNVTAANTLANLAYNQANASFNQANTAYGQANTALTVGNQALSAAIVANGIAQSAYTTANSATNTVATFAQGTLVLPKANLNFNNTSTVNVIAIANGTTQVNLAFSVNTSLGGGTVTQVDTGIGLTGGPINSTGTISANIANATVQGVTKLIDSISSNDSSNAATANSVEWAANIAKSAYDQANTALSDAEAAYGQANTAITIADGANAEAAAANGLAQSAYTQANSAYALANSANNLANTALYVPVFTSNTYVGAEKNLVINMANTSNLSIVGADDSTNGNIILTLDTTAAHFGYPPQLAYAGI